MFGIVSVLSLPRKEIVRQHTNLIILLKCYLMTVYIVINPGCWINKCRCEIKHKFLNERTHIYFGFFNVTSHFFNTRPPTAFFFASYHLRYSRCIDVNTHCHYRVFLLLIDLKAIFNIRRLAAFTLLYLKYRMLSDYQK